MCEGLLDRDALLGVERERLAQKVERERARVGVQARKVFRLADREGAKVVARAARRNGVKLLDRGGAQDVEDERQLVVVVPARK